MATGQGAKCTLCGAQRSHERRAMRRVAINGRRIMEVRACGRCVDSLERRAWFVMTIVNDKPSAGADRTTRSTQDDARQSTVAVV